MKKIDASKIPGTLFPHDADAEARLKLIAKLIFIASVLFIIAAEGFSEYF